MSQLPTAHSVSGRRRPRRTARLGLALVTGALMAVLLSSGANAATTKVSFFFLYGDSCVYGMAKPDASIKLVVKNAAGATVGKGTTQIDSGGYWEFCEFYPVVRPGMSFKATVFTPQGTLTTTTAKVPDLSVKVDRETDMLSGRAPANSTVLVSLSDYTFSHWGLDYDVYEAVHVGASGSWSHDFGADGINIRGGAGATIEWINAAGTIDVLRFAYAPQLGLTRRSPELSGFTRMNGGVDVMLTDGINQVASGHAAGDWQVGSYWGLLSDANDELYDLRGGEWLTASGIGSGVSWQVPAGIGSVDKVGDVVNGGCFPHGRYVVYAFDRYDYAVKYGTASANGSFSKDMSSKINLRRGTTVQVVCYTNAGDYFADEVELR